MKDNLMCQVCLATIASLTIILGVLGVISMLAGAFYAIKDVMGY